MDYATLLLYFLLFQQQTVGPVEEYQQTRVDDALARRGYITYIIHRLIYRGVRIQVCTKLHAHAFTPAQHLVALEVLRTIEGHVLQEVSQTALVVILLNRAHFLGNVELGTLFRPCVVTDVISQSIVQFAHTHIWVNGNRWQLHGILCHNGYSAHQHECSHE